MKLKHWIFLLIGLAITFLIIKRKKVAAYNYLKDILDKFEGFTETPKWDYKQWSWGFGTKVPGSPALEDWKVPKDLKISKTQAYLDAYNFLKNHEAEIKKLLKVDLSGKQMAALLSFSYNLGMGNAKKIIKRINDGDKEALEYSWKSYNKAGGEVLQGLVKRREFEWKLFSS